MNEAPHILLADDDDEDFFILSEAFKEINFPGSIHWVQNGEKVMEFLNGLSAEDVLPSLIVLDLNMPRLNGAQTLKAVKSIERFRHIPVIIFSTSINPQERMECLNGGATSYEIKPSTYTDSLQVAKMFFGLCRPQKAEL